MEERSLLLWRGPEVSWGAARRVLHTLPSLRLVGDTTHAEEARILAAEQQPDAIIAPTRQHGISLLPTLAALHRDCAPRSKFILFAPDCSQEDFIGTVES